MLSSALVKRTMSPNKPVGIVRQHRALEDISNFECVLPKIQEENGCDEMGTRGRAMETTPSSRTTYCQTPTSKNTKTSDAHKPTSSTPLSSRRQPTPKTPKVIPRNPFCTDADVSRLQLPIWSPNVFNTVVSPTKSLDGDNFDWPIEDISRMKPVLIDEDPEHLIPREDPETESKIENALATFWNGETQIVPSPWQENGKVVKYAKTFSAACKDAASQTMLTLPPILPPDLENALMPYLNRDSGILVSPESMLEVHNESNESFSSSLSQCGLRRKLSFMMEDNTNCPSSPIVSMATSKGLLSRTDKDSSVLRSPTMSPIKSLSASQEERDGNMSLDLGEQVANHQSYGVSHSGASFQPLVAFDDQTMDSLAPGHLGFQGQSTDHGYLTETSSINFAHHFHSRLPDYTLPSEPWVPHLGSSTPSSH
ncbi:uncharacterized protein bora [Cloeon dipterum]|uniref:uncharacterized protein bora n=1 Tax=Cloeon dipterum TaxID=197152 RepID=UPI00321FB6DB